jgi:hypothetical protein
MDAVPQPACCGRRASPSRKPSRHCNGPGARLARPQSRGLPACPAERRLRRVHRRGDRCRIRLCTLLRELMPLRHRARLPRAPWGPASMAGPGAGRRHPGLLPRHSPAPSTAAAPISRCRLPRRSCWRPRVSGSKAGGWRARCLRHLHPIQPRGPLLCALPRSHLPPRAVRPIILAANPSSIRTPRARARQARPAPSRPCGRRTARLRSRYGPGRHHRRANAHPRLRRLPAGPRSTIMRRPRLRRAPPIWPDPRHRSVAKRPAKPHVRRPCLGLTRSHWERDRPARRRDSPVRNGTSPHRAQPEIRTPSSSTTAIRRARPILIPTMPPGPTRLLPLHARLAVRGCRRPPAPGNGARPNFHLHSSRTRSRAG